MAQMVSRGGSRLAPVSVVTVADLLSRNAPVTTKLDVNESGTGVSVGSLLRREGRAPHALDRPVQPRAHQEFEGADEPTTVHAVVEPAGKSAIVKRGAVAAGALLAVGSVLGAAALTEIAPTGTEAQGAQGDGWAGQGRLDKSSAAPVLPTASVIDPSAATDSLDAGTAAPTSWVPVAFPTAIAGVPTVLAAANGAPSSVAAGGSQSTGGSSFAPGAPATGASAARTTENPAPPAPPTAAGNSAVAKVGNTAGGTVENVGGALPGTVGKTVGGLGTTVKDTGDTLDKVTAPVTDKLSPVTGPVVSLLSTDSSARTSAPQQADKESSSDNDDKDSRHSRSDDNDRSDTGGKNDSDRDSGGSGGLLGGVGKVAAGLLGG